MSRARAIAELEQHASEMERDGLRGEVSRLLDQNTELRQTIENQAKTIARLRAALRAVIERTEHRMSSKVIDDVVEIARRALEQKG